MHCGAMRSNTGHTMSRSSDEIQKMMTESKCDPEQFNGRIIFMSMYNDIDRRKRPETHGARGNPPRMKIWNQWLYRQNFPLLTLFLRLTRMYRETWSRNSQNFLNNRI